MFPWRYGDAPSESEDSFVLARANAFASKAAFPTSAKRIAPDAPVVGFLGPSSGLPKSAQLAGRGTAKLLEWNPASRHTFPPVPPPHHRPPWGFNPDTILAIPQLLAASMNYTRPPQATATYISDPVFSLTQHTPCLPHEEADATHQDAETA